LTLLLADLPVKEQKGARYETTTKTCQIVAGAVRENGTAHRGYCQTKEGNQ